MSDDPGAPPDGLLAVVRAVGELLRAVHAPPSLIRVRSGEVAVHVEWPDTGAPPTGTAQVPAAGDRDAEPDRRHYVCAPHVGMFYRATEPGAAPFVDVGDKVAAGQQVAIIEAMKLMLPVEADRNGTITEVLLADGTPVEYDARLFAIAPDGTS